MSLSAAYRCGATQPRFFEVYVCCSRGAVVEGALVGDL
jgi:hypothetical protein